MLETPAKTSPDLSQRVHVSLHRVLESRHFASSPRLSQFLRHVVEHTLEGNLSELKEVSIGMAVFTKAPSYDPKEEPIVRVEARRLRARLDDYYTDTGKNDPVRICLPRGAYLALFESLHEPLQTGVELAAPGPEPSLPAPTLPLPQASPAESHPAPSAPRRQFARPVRVLILVAVVAFAAGVGSVLLSLMSRTKALSFQKVIPVASYPGNQLQPAISHDGRQVAFVWNGGKADNYDVYVKLLDLGSPVRLTSDPAHDLWPQWSPDDRYIAFLRVSDKERGVFVLPALGGSERKVAALHRASEWKSDALQVRAGAGPAWSPDGKDLLIVDQESALNPAIALYWQPVDGSRRRQITHPLNLAHDFNAAVAHRHPRIAFVRETSNSSGDLFTCDFDGNHVRQITFDRARIGGIAWSADDHSLVFTSNRGGADELWQLPSNGGAPEKIATKGYEVSFPAISDDGSILAYTATTQNSNIWRLPIASGDGSDQKPELLIASTGINDSPSYSPDGKSIAFVSNRLGSWELWLSDSDGSNQRQLTNFGGPMVGTPHWSSDSRYLVFDARPHGRSIIYTVDTEAGSPQPIIDDGFEDKKPNWSRDGKSLYYTSNRDGTSQLWRSGIHGEHPVRLTTVICNDSAESLDGKTIYFQNDNYGIYQMPTGGGSPQIVQQLDRVYPSRYFDVTDRVYVVDQENSPRTIREYDPHTGSVSTVGSIAGQLVYGTPSLSVSADHRYLLFAQQDRSSSEIITLRK